MTTCIVFRKKKSPRFWGEPSYELKKKKKSQLLCPVFTHLLRVNSILTCSIEVNPSYFNYNSQSHLKAQHILQLTFQLQMY